jgi:CheY-like chemotaxis protein
MDQTMLSVLIADDDPDDRQSLAEGFSRQNPQVRVHCVKDGKEALLFLCDRHSDELPNLIVVDFQMPELTGVELIQLLERDPRYEGMTKIIWSASIRDKDVGDCLQSGAEWFFQKPNDQGELNVIVDCLTLLLQKAARVHSHDKSAVL